MPKSTLTRTAVIDSKEKLGETIRLAGWVANKREHAKVTFIDLRDESGIIQCVGIDNKLKDLTIESVVEVIGKINKRPEGLINEEMVTGQIELFVEDYQILNKSIELPIDVEGSGMEINEEVRLQYRYLDLRRQRLQKNLRFRSKLINSFRQELLNQDFVEIETPMLTKSTKEGARDFIVPSRFHPGKFYALPQSPQQYKQLLMAAGFEKYFQLARCIRDEDLRADRGFEFTQLDIEMSFANQSEIMNLLENLVKKVCQQLNIEIKDQQFPVITYQEAMEKYGADRFDLRSTEDKDKGLLAFAWVVRFPFFKKVNKTDRAETLDSKSTWTFTHNPFSSPNPEHIANHLAGEKIEQIISSQYDLVCNGYEVAGGSLRAHQAEVLRATFRIMGYNNAEIEASIGHMLKAFELGTPPHGGIAFGIDRLLMLMMGEENLRETMAFLVRPPAVIGKAMVSLKFSSP
ncbi:MAG: aspartate--tRNA ligase, partial [Candidatus Pacebacteria bacterium]|nr:aspartate--tRNA ligase [Candidatus Paceibacterota bacterium]